VQPPVAPPHDPPAGFVLLSLPAAGMALVMVLAMLASELNGGPGGHLFERGAMLALGTLSTVVFEALLLAPPWAFRASLALALTFLATVAGLTDPGVWVLEAALCFAFLAPVLGYVYHRCKSIHRQSPPSLPQP
jgi:hypothetical protein